MGLIQRMCLCSFGILTHHMLISHAWFHHLTCRYDVYLRPCSEEMLDAIEVSMIATVANQIEISPSVLIGSDFGSECKATVHVSAVDDEWAEGDHYSAILHEVKNKTSGEDIMLADNSPLLASNLLVNIYDDDTAGIIIRESNKITSTVELDDDDKDVVGNATYYEDEYFLRLTKNPSRQHCCRN